MRLQDKMPPRRRTLYGYRTAWRVSPDGGIRQKPVARLVTFDRAPIKTFAGQQLKEHR